ncbi:MAG: T9SS type A sorting domain-containing protein [Bacteroidota bacterium]|nr:T9SS type A sorting domain-containing protein [Bacteroidota bacterium]
MNKSKPFLFSIFFLLFLNANAKSFPVSLPLNANPNPFSGIVNGDTIVITSVLTINASINYPQTDLVLIIENNGSINWPNNSNLTIGSGGVVFVKGSGGLTNSSSCNANKSLTIGTVVAARCNGASGSQSFSAVNTSGGLNQAGTFSLLSLQNEKVNIERNGFINTIQWISHSTSPIKTAKLKHSFNQFKWNTIDVIEINKDNINYAFDHFQPESSNDFYQLEVEFFDGTIQMSSIYKFYQSKNIKIQIYPNPFTETLFISDCEIDDYKIIIFDINGKEINTIYQKEINSIQIDLSE